MKPEIYTVGHSNRTLAEFIGLLKAHGIELVADVRSMPRSRHNPQFNREGPDNKNLPDALRQEGIKYAHLDGLGGLRHSKAGSPNMGWRNLSFRGFADYMQTEGFKEALGGLVRLAKGHRTAIMCAEALQWRCHRSLIADALAVRGFPVLHITSSTRAMPHNITPWARVEGTVITYPEAPEADANNV